jgi:hypothetical protein
MGFLRWPLRTISRAWRRRYIAQLLDDLAQWEADGRDLLAQVVELTDDGDDIHREAVRILELLEGP